MSIHHEDGKYYENENFNFFQSKISDIKLNLHYGVLFGKSANRIFWHGIHHDFHANK